MALSIPQGSEYDLAKKELLNQLLQETMKVIKQKKRKGLVIKLKKYLISLRSYPSKIRKFYKVRERQHLRDF